MYLDKCALGVGSGRWGEMDPRKGVRRRAAGGNTPRPQGFTFTMQGRRTGRGGGGSRFFFFFFFFLGGGGVIHFLYKNEISAKITFLQSSIENDPPPPPLKNVFLLPCHVHWIRIQCECMMSILLHINTGIPVHM